MKACASLWFFIGVFGAERYKNLRCLRRESRSSLPRNPLIALPVCLPIMNLLYRAFAILPFAVTYFTAEKHTVSFDNRSVVASVDSRRFR